MYESILANFLNSLSAPYNVASIIPALLYINMIYFLLMFFRKDENYFSEHTILSFLLVSFVFLGLANVMNWVHNTLSLTQGLSGTTFYSLRHGISTETLKIPGYSFLLASVLVFYNRMRKL